MEVTLFMPYYDYNDGNFDVSDNYYSDDEYVKRMRDEYNANKDVVFDSMLNAKNGSSSLFQGADGQTYKFGSKEPQNEDKVVYSSCNAALYDCKGKPYTVDGLITHFAKQESFIAMVELDIDTSEEEFESEIMLWMREHVKINEYKDKNGEEWAWSNEPIKDVKMSFKNNSDEELFSMLRNCKIMDILDDGNFILYIERMVLVDK